MKRLHIALLLLALCTPHLRSQTLWGTEETYPKRELRAVWLTTLYGLDWPKTHATDRESMLRQQHELCDMLDRLQAVGINTVLLQTRVRGSVIYPSDIEPWDDALTGTYGGNPGYDPLAFAIEEAHRRGMELHAWVVTIPAFKTEVASKMGGKSLLKTHPELLRKHDGMYYLDPGEPQTAAYLVSICREIVSRYDVDGLHFDYIRYPENAASFPDSKTYSKYGKGTNKADWRRQNVTSIVRQTYQAVKQLKPWVKMSCSPVGKFRDTRRASSKGWDAYDAVYQDAKGWLREGIQDALYPMMYFTDEHFYPFVIDWSEGTYGRFVAPGLGIYFLSPKEKNWPLSIVTQQLRYVRRADMAGQCYFRAWFLLSNQKGLYDYLRGTYYAYPALPPAYTWLDDEPPTAPTDARRTDLSTDLSTGMTELTWQPSTDNLSEGGVRYNVYASTESPVDVSRAENLVCTNLPEPRFVLNPLPGLHLAVTAIDRCGNESAPLQIDKGNLLIATSPEAHYLPHDGDTLPLPAIDGAVSYTITDITARTVATGTWTDTVDISSLPRGVYRLLSHHHRGAPTLVGEFKK